MGYTARMSPSRPMAAAQVEALGLMAPRLGDARARRVVEVIRALGAVPAGDLARLIAS
jgi:hypothetical protein